MDNNYQNMVNVTPVSQQAQNVGNLQNNLTQTNQPIQDVGSSQSNTIPQQITITSHDTVNVIPSQENNVDISTASLEFDLPSVSDSTAVSNVSSVTNTNVAQEENNNETFNQDNISPSDINDVSFHTTSVSNKSVSVRKYLGYMFLYSIPGIGIILLIINAFRQEDENIKNFSKAYLIFLILMLLFIFIIYFVAVFVLKFSFNN